MLFISILILISVKAFISFKERINKVNINLSSTYFTRISAIIFIYSGLLSYNCYYIQSIGSGIGIYSGLFHITQISQLIEIFILIMSFLILISWPLSLNEKFVEYSSDYSIIVLFSILGSLLLICSLDLVSMYLSIELQSFGLYILSTLYRNSESSTSAGLKYFLLGGLSSCLILLGAAIIYSLTGLTNLESLFSLISASELNNLILGISLGLIIIFVGFLFKIAAAPLHNWAPDVYNDTPTIVTIWLTIMPKISILFFILELYVQIGYIGEINIGYIEYLNISLDKIINNNISLFTNLLLISSLLSLIIGTVVGLAQTQIKRLLAYSTISHIGFILLALSINTEQSIDSFIFYIIQYSLTNLNVFLILIALSYIKFNPNINLIKDIKYITELKGQFYENPLLSLSFSICLFSMAGIPPLVGFFSKQFVLYSAIQNGFYFIGLIAILVSVVSASYYLKIIRILHTEILSEYLLNNSNINNNSIVLTNFHSFLISSLTLIILLFILKPSLILNSTQLLSLSLFKF